MIFALVTGQLFEPPEQRTSKAGNPFVAATILAKDGDSAQWWRVTAFAEAAQTELMRLADGDALTVQGPLKAELYSKDGGEQKLSLSIIANLVLALRQPPKERAARAPQRRVWRRGDGPDDEIPFGEAPR